MQLAGAYFPCMLTQGTGACATFLFLFSREKEKCVPGYVHVHESRIRRGRFEFAPVTGKGAARRAHAGGGPPAKASRPRAASVSTDVARTYLSWSSIPALLVPWTHPSTSFHCVVNQELSSSHQLRSTARSFETLLVARSAKARSFPRSLEGPPPALLEMVTMGPPRIASTQSGSCAP